MFPVWAVQCGRGPVSVYRELRGTCCRAVGSTGTRGEHRSAGRMLPPRWSTGPAPPPQDACSQPVCACVRSHVCARIDVYVHIGPDAYLKNKELLNGMIFPFLLSGVFILRFHYLSRQGFFQGTRLQEYPSGCLGRPSPALLPSRQSPPSSVLPAQLLGRQA